MHRKADVARKKAQEPAARLKRIGAVLEGWHQVGEAPILFLFSCHKGGTKVKMGTKLKPGVYDGYNRALHDEPMFTLLARDPMAPKLVDLWADKRQSDINEGVCPITDVVKVNEARACAEEMRSWRDRHMGAECRK